MAQPHHVTGIYFDLVPWLLDQSNMEYPKVTICGWRKSWLAQMSHILAKVNLVLLRRSHYGFFTLHLGSRNCAEVIIISSISLSKHFESWSDISFYLFRHPSSLRLSQRNTLAYFALCCHIRPQNFERSFLVVFVLYSILYKLLLLRVSLCIRPKNYTLPSQYRTRNIEFCLLWPGIFIWSHDLQWPYRDKVFIGLIYILSQCHDLTPPVLQYHNYEIARSHEHVSVAVALQ
jgi:hypothetical protein